MKGTYDRRQMAARVAEDIEEGMYVNLGIGLPTVISDYLPADREIILHTENGMLGMGPEAHGDEIDPDLLNAGKIPVTELPGASYFDHALSFGMIRGGHLDVCVLGAYQVSVHGDIANWHTGGENSIPAVGGAMDLAIGAKRVYAIMELFTKDGECKLVPECTYPVTGVGCISAVYTDFAVFDITPDGVVARDIFGDVTLEKLRELTGIALLAPSVN